MNADDFKYYIRRNASVPRSNQNAPAGGLGADKAFLDHRGNKAAVIRKEEPARETARAAGCWAVLRVEKPIVGTKRPMKPQGMIEARDLKTAIEYRMTVRAKHSIEKCHVGEIRKNRAMNSWIAGERPTRAQPYVLFGGARFVPRYNGADRQDGPRWGGLGRTSGEWLPA